MARFSGRYLEATINHRVGHPPPCERPADVVCQACDRERYGCATITLRVDLGKMTATEVLGVASDLIQVGQHMASDWPRRDPTRKKVAAPLRAGASGLDDAASHPSRSGGNGRHAPPQGTATAF
jgi:hypothetical protein